LGRGLTGGCFIALRGDLGAGKTAFVQGLSRGLGSKGRVTSPTFTLLHQLEDGRLPLYHFDLYRIDGDECDALGFDEYFFDPALVCAVEWSERMGQLPRDYILVEITITGEDSRTISVKMTDQKLLKEKWSDEHTCT